MTEQIPKLDDFLVTGTEALLAARPRAAAHLKFGRYGDVIAGWRAQGALLRRQLARESAAALLSSSGAELRELLSSEYWVIPDESPSKARGEVLLRRFVSNSDPGSTGQFGSSGVIKAGTGFRRAADETAIPERVEALYESIEPVMVEDVDTVTSGAGPTYTHQQDIRVPISATVDGTGPNTVLLGLVSQADAPGEIADTLFDSAITLQGLYAAGGGTGPTDDVLRALAIASATGKFGPTDTALVTGALLIPGVFRAVVANDWSTATARLWIADETWAYSEEFGTYVERELATLWKGWGCKVDAQCVTNTAIRIKATVVTDQLQGSDKTAVANAIRKRVQEHLDAPPWWTWELNTLGAVVANADSRILACTAVSVTGTDGAAISEPAATLSPFTIRHYLLERDGVEVTFTEPS